MVIDKSVVEMTIALIFSTVFLVWVVRDVIYMPMSPAVWFVVILGCVGVWVSGYLNYSINYKG